MSALRDNSSAATSGTILVLSSHDLQTVMRFDDYVDAVAEGFQMLAEGRCESPVPMHINVADGTFHAFLWEKGVMTELGPDGDPTGRFSPSGINAAGQVVGDSGRVGRAVLVAKGVTTDLGTLGGNIGAASAINPAGQIAGSSSTVGFGPSHATLWTRN